MNSSRLKRRESKEEGKKDATTIVIHNSEFCTNIDSAKLGRRTREALSSPAGNIAAVEGGGDGERRGEEVRGREVGRSAEIRSIEARKAMEAQGRVGAWR